jgi:glycosyltransferase involved in cell wall biosynthesis
VHRVSVVIPALNEAKNLPHVLPLIPRGVHEVILVDGQSTDGTDTVAREMLPGIRLVKQHGPGKGSALCTGFAAATGEIIVMLDADGSMDPREIPLFVDALTDGADLVKGSRFLRGGGTSDMPLYRKLGNACFVRTVRQLFGGMSTDLCYGYSAFWTRILPQLRLDATGFEIETQMALRAQWAGLRVVEVPSFEARRIYGSSNLRTIPDGWRVSKQILRERFRNPIPRGSATIASGKRVVGIPVMSEFVGVPVMSEFPKPLLGAVGSVRFDAKSRPGLAVAPIVEIARRSR